MLEQMRGRLRTRKTFDSAVERILDDVIALHGAEFGDIQLPIGNKLVIVAERGLTTKFLNAFARVDTSDGCACGQALRSGEPVVIRDVEEDLTYEAFREDARAAGYRGVQSTPFLTQDGIFMAMVSSSLSPRPFSLSLPKDETGGTTYRGRCYCPKEFHYDERNRF